MFSAYFALHLLAVSQADSEVQSLLERHQRYLDAIQTLDVEVRADTSEDGGRTWRPNAVIRWRMDRRRGMQRFTSVFHGKLANGQSALQDYCYGPDGSRFLEYPDAPLPESLGPANEYGRVWAHIDGGGPGLGPRVACYWLFLWGAAHTTLRESFEAATAKKFLGKVNIDGRELWGLELVEPESKMTYAFYLDPALNYGIVRREVRTSNDVYVHCVLESKEVPPGISFPMRALNRGTKDMSVLDVRVQSVKINEPLPEDAFVVPFPSGAKVRNDKTGEVYIWGDSAPAHVFADNREVRAWELEQMGYGRSQSIATFVLTNAALLAAITGAYLVRRYYLRRAVPRSTTA